MLDFTRKIICKHNSTIRNSYLKFIPLYQIQIKLKLSVSVEQTMIELARTYLVLLPTDF